MQQTPEQWQYVFIIAAAGSFIGGIIYVLFTRTEVQSWNNILKRNSHITENNSTEGSRFKS